MLFLQVESENHVGACRVIVIPVRNSVRPDSLDRRQLSPMRKKRGLSVVCVRVKKNPLPLEEGTLEEGRTLEGNPVEGRKAKPLRKKERRNCVPIFIASIPCDSGL